MVLSMWFEVLQANILNSTLIVSCLRIERVMSYAKSQNPTWDNIPADYWSVMEANLGVFCVCMPALRRIFAHSCPTMFGSSRHKSRSYEYTPNDKPSKGSKGSKGRRRNSIIGGSLWTDTGITKTVDATVTYGTRKGSEDEVELVEQRRAAEERSIESGQGTINRP
jgi:hypothetical protein